MNDTITLTRFYNIDWLKIDRSSIKIMFKPTKQWLKRDLDEYDYTDESYDELIEKDRAKFEGKVSYTTYKDYGVVLNATHEQLGTDSFDVIAYYPEDNTVVITDNFV